MTDIQQEVGMCVRCWGKAFTAAYGIGSKTQAGEYERIVAGCECTPWQRLGVADSFAEGYEARLAEDAKVRAGLVEALESLRKVLKDEGSVKVTADFAGQMMFGRAVLLADAALDAAKEIK